MRLLHRSADGRMQLTLYPDDHPPPYAILSHTWNGEREVTYQELLTGVGLEKEGHSKIEFCIAQAAADQIEYSWVDTCCIDKSTNDELSTAINSMFRWYQGAAKCYVFMSDVEVPNGIDDPPAFKITWMNAFRRSRWFTRGWTLQELLAPASVEFFSRNGKWLGNKLSLEREIHEITRIPIEALRHAHLSEFSVEERLRWTAGRSTTKPEDKAYSLLGIFNIFLPLIYGEGEEHAFRRIHEEVRRRRLSTSSSASESPSRRVISIPFTRNRQFVGRQKVLKTLERKLFTVQDCQKLAVVGFGGIGKTQVVLSFAYAIMEQQRDVSIFWVPAVSPETFERAMGEIARELGIRTAADKSGDVKEVVKRDLSRPQAGKWLLIIDNADDMRVMVELLPYLPHSPDGSVIFTSQTIAVAQQLVGSNTIELEKLQPDEAMQLLTHALNHKELLQETNVVTEFFEELDYLPLAITQAAAYLNINTNLSIAEYLRLIRGSDDDKVYLLNKEIRDNTRYKHSRNAVARIWLVSFEQIQERDSAAADLLRFIACIEWQDIPLSILPVIRPKARMLEAIGMLCSYGFVSKRVDGMVYDMHRLVHLASWSWLLENDQLEGRERQVIAHLAAIFPTDDCRNRATWRAYMPHAARVRRWQEHDGCAAEVMEASQLYYKVGRCLYGDGRMNEALQWLRHACRLRAALAEDHPSRLALQHMLARTYQANGQTKKAIQLLEHVVTIWKTSPAEHHPNRLASQHALAGAYQANGQTKKAIQLLEHVVTLRSKRHRSQRIIRTDSRRSMR